MSAARALAYARAHRRRFVSELKEFIRIPTVSAVPAHAEDVRRGGSWLASHLSRIGLERVRLLPTAGHPLVYAEWRHAAAKPTLLIYGHYDVQPADPLQEWHSPPFVPTLRGDDLFGRGACDDKGQLFTHLKAIEAHLRTAGILPLNVICVFEGEEEIGSPNLLRFIDAHRRLLAADAAVISDTRMLGKARPAISYAERGLLSLELELRGAAQDLHSGTFGGAVPNAAQALCELIGRLHDARGRIAIPGMYDQVRRYSGAQRITLSRSAPGDAQILKDARARAAWGEHGYSLQERTTLRPALAVNGITGGYQGSGSKSIIPARASAKLSVRLVPDQDPRMVERLIRRHIARSTPPGMSSRVRTLARAAPVIMNPRHPVMRAAALAYRKGFAAAPAFTRSGGTIPVLSALQRTLRIPTVLMGFALPDDRMHAPNEKFHLPNFFKGVDTSIWFLHAMARIQGSAS